MTRPDPTAPFRWEDGERVILFGPGALDGAPELLGRGFALLTTPRAERAAPDVVERADAVHHVPAGRVDEIASGLRPEVRAELLVALGGGRVIDTAKALAAADPPRRVAAIPTTLSAAEMTRLHRHAAGVAAGARRVRPAMVVCDPALSASQPEPALAASAANALAHGFPQQTEDLDAAAGGDAISAAAALARRAGPIRLREVRVTAEQVGECADAAAGRGELALTPPAPDREELVALYEAAW